MFKHSQTKLFIGLMSGTSINAIDAVLADFDQHSLKLLSTHSEPITPTLKQAILALCAPGRDGVNHLGATDVVLGRLFAQTALALLQKSGIGPNTVRAIGSHGQTIRHVPNSECPFTLQIGDPNIIATLTGITTVADFRRRDIALGGQAAPLTPAFHAYLLRNKKEDRFVVNIGGISNMTVLRADAQQPVIGFDTGPGNMLLDGWCFQHTGKEYDEDGRWGASGSIHTELLQLLLSDAYFAKPLPKSTGREYFNLAWLEHYLKRMTESITPADVQATLTELTAQSIALSIQHYKSQHTSVWLCGGGCHNQFLVARIKQHCPDFAVQTTAAAGIDPEWIEAAAFAWLAKQTLDGLPGNLPSVTGARSASVLGAIYPA